MLSSRLRESKIYCVAFYALVGVSIASRAMGGTPERNINNKRGEMTFGEGFCKFCKPQIHYDIHTCSCNVLHSDDRSH